MHAKNADCAELGPSCSQCVRAKRKCLGYRDVSSLVFHDEHNNILRRINKTKPLAVEIRQEKHHAAIPMTTRRISLSSLVLHPSAEERAMAIFVSHYVVGKSKSFEYLGSCCAISAPFIDGHLSASLRAVSLAEFSLHQQSSGLLRMAREWYVTSLRLISAALRTEEEATKDSTLLAILLLDLFEKITAIHHKRAISSITEHIHGASKLVQLRGPRQLDSPFGLYMFMQFTSLLMESCAQCKVRVPPQIIALLQYAQSISDPTGYQWRILEAFESFTALQADIAAGLLTDPRDIIAEAQRQEDECEALCRLFQTMWPYTSHCTTDMWSAYQGIYHVYATPFLAVRAWNTIRIGRILINEIIRRQIVLATLSMPPLLVLAEYMVQFKAAGDTITDMTLEICGCIPQYAMDISTADSPSTLSDQQMTLGSSVAEWEKCHTADRIYTYAEQASAYSLIFSLFIIGRSPECPARLCLWVLNRLHYIGHVIGLSDAILVSRLLVEESDIDPWTVAAMLGGHNAQNLE